VGGGVVVVGLLGGGVGCFVFVVVVERDPERPSLPASRTVRLATAQKPETDRRSRPQTEV